LEALMKFKNLFFHMKDGMLLYIGPDVPHALETDPEVPVNCFTVHFSYALVNIDEGQWNIKEERQNSTAPGCARIEGLLSN
jgi:hypothetical protein